MTWYTCILCGIFIKNKDLLDHLRSQNHLELSKADTSGVPHHIFLCPNPSSFPPPNTKTPDDDTLRALFRVHTLIAAHTRSSYNNYPQTPTGLIIPRPQLGYNDLQTPTVPMPDNEPAAAPEDPTNEDPQQHPNPDGETYFYKKIKALFGYISYLIHKLNCSALM
jgi:hypothetical protein